jgi:hypothetical protein
MGRWFVDTKEFKRAAGAALCRAVAELSLELQQAREKLIASVNATAIRTASSAEIIGPADRGCYHGIMNTSACQVMMPRSRGR